MRTVEARSFLVADARLRKAMVEEGRRVHTATWQGADISTRPEAEMVELLNVTLGVDLRGITSLEQWRQEIRPNLPWADEHLEERVSGQPLNPPPSWVRWPWANSADKFRSGERFNHTYPERYWPKFAAGGGRTWDDSYEGPHRGIRGEYGDLNDVVELLRRDPLTRQAYLPIFFPEDTGVGDGGRKPCSLGYQFIVRPDPSGLGSKLHCFYPMRSVDLTRHFRDDCYLTVRLLLWVLEELKKNPYSHPITPGQIDWLDVFPGSLTMHMTSLHCFIGDWHLLKAEHG